MVSMDKFKDINALIPRLEQLVAELGHALDEVNDDTPFHNEVCGGVEMICDGLSELQKALTYAKDNEEG